MTRLNVASARDDILTAPVGSVYVDQLCREWVKTDKPCDPQIPEAVWRRWDFGNYLYASGAQLHDAEVDHELQKAQWDFESGKDIL